MKGIMYIFTFLRQNTVHEYSLKKIPDTKNKTGSRKGYPTQSGCTE